ncbi:MAG: ATP-dependent helicase [Calditrichota bacterium]
MNNRFSEFLRQLNEEQRQAVVASNGPQLVLAGAGSGKTRVLTGRAFFLLANEQVNPAAIVVMTFTNKAAGELKTRLQNYLGEQTELPWAGTFHGFCARLLRQHGTAIEIPRDFTIYDTADTEQVLSGILAEQKIGRDALTPAVLRSWISLIKNGGSLSGRHPLHSLVPSLLSEYDRRLRNARAVDFDDLLRLPIQMMKANTQIREVIQRRYDHILVDEFQDTNRYQYELSGLLAAPQNNLYVVGDDDQSIYGWRGADYRNILDFRNDFPSAGVFRLERNYRSTQPILDVANDIIAANKNREPKRLWTDKTQGDKTVLRQVTHGMDEAHEVVGEIQQLVRRKGYNYRDVAILFRTNALSRPFEEVLIGQAVPYTVVGGTRFYDRKEVRDLLAYLRLLANPDDDQACRRALRTPARGIGDKTIEALENEARRNQCGMGSLLLGNLNKTHLTGAVLNKLQPFSELLNRMRAEIAELDLVHNIEMVLQLSGLEPYYQSQEPESAEERIANLEELVDAAHDRMSLYPDYSLTEFLGEVALMSDVDDYDESPDRVTLMTVHAAKGLEYPIVFVAAVEEGILPHQRSMDSKDELDEERRLLYVAITRAQERLYLTYAQNRYTNGVLTFQEPSRFLRDISTEHIQGWTLPGRNRTIYDYSDESGYGDNAPLFSGNRRKKTSEVTVSSASLYKIGDLVQHPEFGFGVVTAKAGGADDLKVRVAFEGMGSKLLAVKYAPLRKVE